MPDDRSDIYLDLSFFEDSDASEDSRVDFQAFPADSIGQRTIKVEFTTKETTGTATDIDLEYITAAASAYTEDVSLEYTTVEDLTIDSSDYDVSFSTGESNDLAIDLTSYYRFFTTTSGAFDKKVAFISGKEYLASLSTSVGFTRSQTLSGIAEYVANYTNFSGDYIGASPIPYHEFDFDMIGTVQLAETTASGATDTYLDLFFAGWVDYVINYDVYSTYETAYIGPTFEATVISGAVNIKYLDLFSTTLTVSGVPFDVYCSLTDFVDVGFEAQTIDGRRSYLEIDAYSTAVGRPAVTFDVDLFSIKITNFSLDEDQYTDASNFISVDILDDTCPISVSGTVLIVDGIEVPTTLSGITDGYRLYYDPIDDFESLNGPTTFTVHAENECGDVLEKDFYLTFGYIVEYDNPKGYEGAFDYGYNNKIAVRVTAENMASCPKANSVAYIFETEDYKQRDLGASINGQSVNRSMEDLPASIYPQSTAYFYGEEYEVVITAKDFAGNEMSPFILKYIIEGKPSQ